MITVITNGVFEWLHAGHIAHLAWSKSYGDRLVVLLNSDASARRYKARVPALPEADRAAVLHAIRYVDAVQVFQEPEPTAAIQSMIEVFGGPNLVLTKGPDNYDTYGIAGAAQVLRAGGRVIATPPAVWYHASDLRRAAAEGKSVEVLLG